MDRKLASIRTIGSVSPIEGADNIELVTVDGWQCVVKKGEFKPGQFCVYFEIDSFLPIREEFEFLRKSSYKKMGDKEGFRLRTIKLRGQLSQGLVLSTSILTGYPFSQDETFDDVTERLGVIKYEPPASAVRFNSQPSSFMRKIEFPSFIRKTDLDRVQNIWNKIKDSDEQFEVTIKLDGTSCTFYLKDGKFGVCSRNLELEDEDKFLFRIRKLTCFSIGLMKNIFSGRWTNIAKNINKFKLNFKNNIYWEMAKKYDVEKLLRLYGSNMALQGEIIGEGIQRNPEGIKGHEFYLFDIWDIDRQVYIKPFARAIVWNEYFKSLPWCPYVNGLKGEPLSKFNSLNELLAYADGRSLNADIREGVVFKSHSSELTFKVISNKYLLKEEA